MLFHILFFVVAVFSMVNSSRKYDLENDSMKLYGMSVKQVLEEFRKTPEYVHILDEKINFWKNEVTHILEILLLKYQNDLNSEVEKLYSANKSALRTGELKRHPELINLTGVELLEAYEHTDLSSKDKTKLLKLAYKYATLFSHSLIKYIAPEGTQISTRQPYDDDVTESITEHNHMIMSDENGSDDLKSTAAGPDHNRLRTRKKTNFKKLRDNTIL